jgi:hypothetical protein
MDQCELQSVTFSPDSGPARGKNSLTRPAMRVREGSAASKEGRPLVVAERPISSRLLKGRIEAHDARGEEDDVE